MTRDVDIAVFKAKVVEFAGAGAFNRSALSIRNGGGVFERVIGGTVLEIGTYRGMSAAYMAMLCDRVITVDLLHGKMEINQEAFDRDAFWRHMGVADRIEPHLVADDIEKTILVGGLNFDIAFIDGAHDDTVRLDFAITRRCGRVLFHDADDSGRPDRNIVHDFVKSLPSNQVEYMDEVFALWTDPRMAGG